MDESPAVAWTYANDLRVSGLFLGSSMVILGAGMLVVMVNGVDGAATADFLLALGVFLLIFTALLALPRIRARGAVSYSLHVERSMDEVVEAIRGAAEGMGHGIRTEAKASRSRRPPRLVRIEGVAAGFLVRSAPYREPRGQDAEWTELVQIGIGDASEELAREVRDRVAARLATPPATKR